MNNPVVYDELARDLKAMQATSTRHNPPTPSMPVLQRPCRKRIEEATANMLIRGVSKEKMNSLDEIAKLAGQRPPEWKKPKYGDFEYWLARNCGWITDEEIKADYDAYQELREKGRNSGLKYTWEEEPRYEQPKDTGEYIPEMNMKLIKDRNLTDSARRIALFVVRHVYQDNREGRFINMTVSFIMKGLSLSRRTVQRNLSLLQKLGYLQSDVVPSKRTKMCIGLMITLLKPLFPRHHKKKWPEKRRKSGASRMTQNQDSNIYINRIKGVIHRIEWTLRCDDGRIRQRIKNSPIFREPISA